MPIAEGDSAVLRAVFHPTDAGAVSDFLSLETNSPIDPTIQIECSGVGISELSGDVCDLVMTVDNSPYLFSENVVIPEGCSLVIEEGVTVNLNENVLHVLGDLEISGSTNNPVVFNGGEVRLEEGEGLLVSNLQVNSGELNSPYELVYLNNFENVSGAYDFDCISPEVDYVGTGNTTSGSGGCSSFYRTSSYSYYTYEENDGANALRFASDNYDGYIYLDEAPVAVVGGNYSISFSFEVDVMYRNCKLELEVQNDGNWETAWTSVPDLDTYSQENTHLVYFEKYYAAGEEILFRIKNDIASTQSYFDYIVVFIDEVRVERLRNKVNTSQWSLSDESPLEELSASFGDQLQVYGDTLILAPQNNSSVTVNTYDFPVAPMTVNKAGWYIFEFDKKVAEHDDNCYFHIEYSISGNSDWRTLFYADEGYNNYAAPTYDWRKQRNYSYSWLNAGDRVDLRIVAYRYSSSSYDMVLQVANFRMYQFGNEIGDFKAYIESDRDVVGDNCEIPSISVANSGISLNSSTVSELQLANGVLDLENSSIASVKSNGDFIGSIEHCIISNSYTSGISVEGGVAHLDVSHSRIEGHGNNGIFFSAEGESVLEIGNSIVADNDGHGIQSTNPVQISYCTIVNNGLNGFNRGVGLTEVQYDQYGNCITDMDGDGICDELDPLVASWSSQFQDWICVNDENGNGICDENESGTSNSSPSSINNSIVANNNFNSGADILEANAFLQYTYTEPYPYFVEGSFMLEPYSPCVDAAMPWHNDQNMPYGIGGLRADMGAYGGPDNAGWGGDPAPSGSAALQSVADTPQDQGYHVGLTFAASAFDNSIVSDNISHYAIWRHFDPTGEPIASLSEGNWELLGTMPAQGFSGYAYQAEALGNSNTFGDFSSCYTVVAHTDDEDVYWYSNVSCGESVDNLAPDDPDLNGLVLETGEAQISWTPPTEEDYAYTEIYNDDGFTAEVGNDTLVLDPSVIPGYTYTYTAVNYDVNGNASDASSLTLEIPAGLDIIPLTAGWNLISTDRSASTPAIEDVLSSLNEGNVEYVTGFNNGVVLYDPDGYFLFNTLDEFESGYGYWIKVQEDDTLEIAGSLLTDGYMPSLNMGWNLIGYPNAENSTVEAYFDQLLSDESLEYVTGFNQGSSYFDPNGLPFLNSLVQLENGFGYWLKVSQAYDFNGLVTDQVDEPLAALSGATGIAQPNPNYMLLNGTSNLAQEAGKQALVHALDGTVVGALPILEGGYLMTTALYGDDPATEALEGLQAGDEVYFSFEGKRSKEAVVYNGQMELRHINLEFEVQSLFEVFPNPFAESITISGVLEVGGMLDAVVTDSQGRVVAQRPAIEMTAGSYSLDWELPRLAPGYYNCTLRLEGVTLDSMPIMHVEQ